MSLGRRLAALERDAAPPDAGLPPVAIIVNTPDMPAGRVEVVEESEGVTIARANPDTDLCSALPAAGVACRAAFPAPMTEKAWVATFGAGLPPVDEETP